MSHGSGLYVAPYVARGARQVVPASGAFDPTEFLDLCATHPGCSAFLAPTMVARLVQTGRDRPAHLRTIVYGGGPMYVEDLKKAMAAFGPVFVQLYGQGEAPMTITGLRRADHLGEHGWAPDAVLGSVGYARSGVDVAVLDAGGRPAAVGEVGEIVCRGDVVMAGYWNNPAATAEAFAGGWFHSGDLVRQDDEGYIWVVDRKKDMIISGGENIYCAEVENVLAAHPDIVEVAVIGRSHEKWGEVPVAVVVARSSLRTSGEVGLTLADLDEFLTERLARYKHPKALEIVEALPRNPAGKVLKTELRARFAAGDQIDARESSTRTTVSAGPQPG